MFRFLPRRKSWQNKSRKNWSFTCGAATSREIQHRCFKCVVPKQHRCNKLKTSWWEDPSNCGSFFTEPPRTTTGQTIRNMLTSFQFIHRIAEIKGLPNICGHVNRGQHITQMQTRVTDLYFLKIPTVSLRITNVRQRTCIFQTVDYLRIRTREEYIQRLLQQPVISNFGSMSVVSGCHFISMVIS